MKRHYDFLIICGQRSGSHLLGTMLNSHPDIVCHGELFQPKDEFLPTRTKALPQQIKGAILMYTKRKGADRIGATKALEKYISCSRVIHLTRNAEDMAKSRRVQVKMKSEKLGGTHSLRGEELNRLSDEAPTNLIKTRAEKIKGQRKRLRQYLKRKNINVYELSYEKLAGGKDIEEMPYKIAGPLLVFLGIKKYVPLITNLQKTGYSEMVKNV